MKVFEKGFPLKSLKQLWPPGLMSKSVPWRNLCSQSHGAGCCWAVGAQVLDDGRFAFVFPRHAGDLRSRIDELMLNRNNTGPPFALKVACKIMMEIARAMGQLHREGFLHRDLKAANVLCEKLGSRAANVLCGGFYVADFESSVGTVGTSFWRAPEILLALRNRRSNRGLELPFSCAADVYSYAMTFYEVLTGRIPFEDGPIHGLDSVLSGDRPTLPDDIPREIQLLIDRCWHSDPIRRPSFEMITSDMTRLLQNNRL